MKTAEQIDAHLDEHEEKLNTATALKIPDISAIYFVVRPVLEVAKAIFFFKPKWQDAIGKLIAALDSLYPQG